MYWKRKPHHIPQYWKNGLKIVVLSNYAECSFHAIIFLMRFRVLQNLNRVCLWLGVSICFGMSLIGNFQLENSFKKDISVLQDSTLSFYVDKIIMHTIPPCSYFQTSLLEYLLKNLKSLSILFVVWIRRRKAYFQSLILVFFSISLSTLSFDWKFVKNYFK